MDQLALPPWAIVVAWYGCISSITLVAYAMDKSAARRGGRRVSERTLHLLSLAGGWPAAMLGMHLLRHKRQKTRFVIIVWLTALVHLVGWVWWFGRPWG
jgi:uncharacterized membrane protein YsdA (DUF1294 family)